MNQTQEQEMRMRWRLEDAGYRALLAAHQDGGYITTGKAVAVIGHDLLFATAALYSLAMPKYGTADLEHDDGYWYITPAGEAAIAEENRMAAIDAMVAAGEYDPIDWPAP